MATSVTARQWANRLNLSTPLGLLLAHLGQARLTPWLDGLTLATGYRLPVPPAPVFTVGNVILARADLDALAAHHAHSPGLLRHEARHASQYALCLGPLLLPLYGAACAWSWLVTGTWWTANVFETRAGLADGGYDLRGRRRLGRRAGGRCGRDGAAR